MGEQAGGAVGGHQRRVPGWRGGWDLSGNQGGCLGGGVVTASAIAVPILIIAPVTSLAVGMLWDYCFAAPPGGGGRQQYALQESCGYFTTKGRAGEPVNLSGHGTLTLFIEGRVPVVLRDVTITPGQPLTISVDPPLLDKVTARGVADAIKGSKVGSQPGAPPSTAGGQSTPGSRAQPPPSVPTAKECWKRGPRDFASRAVVPEVFSFNITDSSFAITDTGAAFKSPPSRGLTAFREKAETRKTGTSAWSLPSRICDGDEVRFSIRQSGHSRFTRTPRSAAPTPFPPPKRCSIRT